MRHPHVVRRHRQLASDLEAASLQRAKLHGTDMSGMKMAGADLRGAVIWATLPPEWDTSGLADLSELSIKPLDQNEQTALKTAADRVPDADLLGHARLLAADTVAAAPQIAMGIKEMCAGTARDIAQDIL